MTFDEVLTQALALLKRQGRVSYSALKRRFDLDDAYLSDLKDELLYVHASAVEADDRGFTWTGGTEDRQAPPSQSAQIAPPSVGAHAPPAQEISVPAAAERRQLTVMFCDLVASTTLASQFDPEDYRDVVRAYQATCTEVIRRYDGHIAQLLGDGLLVYVGYPVAHEDDAQRAIHTGLGILAAMGDFNTRLQREQGIQLGVRLGIHTGLVVVGEMGGAGRQEQLALGEVPNIAARIQGLAQPNTIMISTNTYRLIQGYFDCEALGVQALRGVAEPVAVYRVLQESGARGRLDVTGPRGLTPLVGREQEVGLLVERWEQVKAGHGQVILLSGDAGIGKSRLVQVLKEHVANQPHTCWECRSLSYFEHTALFPLTDLFHRLLQFQAEDTPDEKFEKLEQMLRQYRLAVEESVPLFAPLLSLPLQEHRYPLLNLSPQRQRQKTLEAIVAILQEHAEQHPVLFILEDLHWTDPTTLECIALLLDQTPIASMLVLLTCRPYFQPAWHHRSYLTEITVNRLSHTQVEQIVNRMTDGKTFPPEVLVQIVERTDGVPLFVEELTKAILESGQLTARNGHYELTGSLRTLTIPATLQDSLMARLDRLVTAKAVAQYAAVIGRQFSYALLQAVSQVDEVMLQYELGRLVEAEIVYHRGVPPQATYTFKHALIQDAAYESLLKSTRQQYHQRIAQVLEAQFPETAEVQPELLAHQHTEAGLIEQAVVYWHKAAQRAAKRSAHVEGIAHLTKGLELLATLPKTRERVQQEVDMQIALGARLLATKGHAAPEVEQTYTHARQLCEHLEDPYQLFPVLSGLWIYYLTRAELQTAQALGEQLLTLAQEVHDAAMLVAAHRVLGATFFFLGAVADAHTQCTQSIALYDAQPQHASSVPYEEDAGVLCRLYTAWTLWLLGYPDQARTRNAEAGTLAQQIARPFSLATALSMAAMFHQFRRERRATQERAEAAISLATELTVLAEALALADTTGARWCDAELHRLQGELLLQQHAEHQAEAENCFHHALDIARSRQAKSLELRAATSLARLWQQQGKRDEARQVLGDVYSWFTEGFDTADLQEAKALLEELA